MLLYIIVALIVLTIYGDRIFSLYAKKQSSPESKKTLKTSNLLRYPLVFLGKSQKVQKPIERLNEKKGKSEEYFFKYLQKFFGDAIHINMALTAGKAHFYPDFCLILEKHQLYIDIEIDEPYNFKGEPTHYIGADTQRNNFFEQAGWVVIRFAEEQVVRQPTQCCKYIAELLTELTKDAHFSHHFSQTPSLSILPSVWTSNKAKMMFADKTRNTYLQLID
ncbi:MAG: DUF559 domain-containing protein [Thermonemataceae bacterium]|nr:DUF559 domain-containing protein [Thermonemataceae bacterium]